MLIEKKKTAELLPAEYNPRKDLKPGDEEYEKLKRSIEEFGYVEPVIWNKTTGRVVGGHQRLKVLIDLGITEVDCVVVEMDDVKEKALNIALNKISGDWDKDKLALLIADLQGEDFDVSLTGFDPAEIDDLFKDSLKDGICDFFGIHSPSKEMAWVGEMLVKGLAGSIDDNGDEAVKAAEGMAEDINDVMGDLANDMQTALPTDFDVSGSFRSAVDGVTGKAASAFTIALNIATFNNYSSEDIRQLTYEVMETANQFAQRKGVVFA